jgi:hypothetical protein
MRNSANLGSMAEQLARIQPSLRQRYSSVLAVSQVSLLIDDKDPSAAFIKARTEILKWLDGRAGRPLPEKAIQGEAFDLEEVGAQRVEVVTLDEPRYWATRLDDADKDVPQRIWVTEASIAVNPSGGVLVGARLVCATRGQHVPFHRSVPGFVRQLIEKCSVSLDGYPIRAKPWLVANESDVLDLVDLIRSPQRRADVIVFALPENSTDPSETAAPAELVYHRSLGAAHVAILTGPASYFLSDAIGKEFSVFQQAVRTYRPGFNENESQRYEHPLTLAHRIEQWPDGGPQAYATFLIGATLAHSVAVPDAERIVPSFASVRRIAAQRRFEVARRHDSSTLDLLALADEEIRTLQRDLQDQETTHTSLLQAAEEERDEARREADAARARVAALRARTESLEKTIREMGGAKVEVPGTLDEFESWCETYLAGTVEIHSRAYQGIKKSRYQDNRLIYRSLLLLRDFYVPMRRQGGADLARLYQAESQALELEEAPSLSSERYGEEGDTYFVQYAGERRALDRHLKRGSSREPRRCFRLYFFWDEDSEQAVVGWLPSHLDTRMT